MAAVRNNARWLELQVAIVSIALGIVAVSSVMATESRLLKRLHASSRLSATPAQPHR